MRRPPVPCARLLPFLSLLIWVFLLAQPAAITIVNLELAARTTGEANLSSGSWSAKIPRANIPATALNWVPQENLTLIAAANLPAVFLELPITGPISWPDTWYPASLTLDAWRGLTYPFFCLPAWWFVGRGIDSLFGRPQLGWLSRIAGSALCLAFAVMGIGLRFALPAADRLDTKDWVFWGIALWTALFAVFPYAWIRHRLHHRRALAPAQERPASLDQRHPR